MTTAATVAISLIAVETLLGYALKRVATTETLGMLYLPGVVAVSTAWGFWPGALTAILSALAMDYFHIPPFGSFLVYDTTHDALTVVLFMAMALLVDYIAIVARSRAIEADERRLEADLAAELARVLLRTHPLSAALPIASRHLAARLGLPFAMIERSAIPAEDHQTAFPLGEKNAPLGTLLVPAPLARTAVRVLQDRVIPSLEELLRAARDRERIMAALQASREDLVASRARIVTAADESRRHIQRDLHDGVQQRLVSLWLKVNAIEAVIPSDTDILRTQLSQTRQEIREALEDLQQVSRGLNPPTLAKRGLGPALNAIARRSPLPVQVNLRLDQRLPEQVEVTIYYIVSEGLANAEKHADASMVQVDLEKEDNTLRLRIYDDGTGGADPTRGSGIIGLKDRVEALAGSIEITSPSGGGTTIIVQIPVEKN